MPLLRRIRYGLWALVAVAAAAFIWLAANPGGPQSAATGGAGTIGAPFELTAEDGSVFSSTRLAGRPYAIFFGFTHCPDICPTSMLEITRAMTAAGERARDFTVLFVSVDPERDTPELLRLYTDSFDPRIIGLSGSPDAITAVARAWRVFWRKVPTGGDSYTMDHTAAIYLMDARGRLIGTISPGESTEAAAAKLQRLLGS
jgi:protein SCO1/2